MGVKGKYALFALIVLLSSQLKAQNINTPNKNGSLGMQVNTLTGNLFVSRSDIYVPARGIDIDVSFAYNTFNYNQNRGFGNGWSFNYAMSYRLDAGGVVTIVQGDNREDPYTPTASGGFTPTPGIFDNLSQYQTGKYLLQTKYGTKYYFDNSAHKRVTKMQDPNGNYLTFGYTDSLVTSITNAAGQTITLTYNGAYLSSVVDAITTPTHTYTYSYDGYGNLIQVLDPNANKMVYTYLVNGPMSGITDKNGNTADVIYFPDFTVSELISCNGRKSFSYDTTSKTTVVTDYVPTSTDQITTYKYKSFTLGAITKTWLTHITGNCCGYNIDLNYDNLGNLLTKTDANGNIYTYTYDTKGNLLTITDPLGNKSSYTYSADYNQVTSYTDANGNSYSINYDNAGNPTQMTEPGNIQSYATYSAFGDLLTATDQKGNLYHVAYDANGYLTQISQPLSSTIGFAYDARGNLLSGTDPNGNISTFKYDALDRLTTIKDPLNHNETVAYDANGNVSSITDPNGHTSSFSYDASNRLVAAIDAAGEKIQYVYDVMDNLIQYTDALGKTTNFSYDAKNRLISIIDPLGNGYNFSYDYNGNMVSIVMPTGSTANYVYDKLDRPVSGSDNIGTLGNVTYDNNGNVTSYTNGTGTTISMTYDNLNRVVKTIDPLGNSKTFTYDNNDNLTSIKDRNGHTATIAYDALNRAVATVDNNGNTTAASYDAASNVLSTTDANNHGTTYSYDGLQRMTATTYPDGSAMHFGYDNLNNKLSKLLPDGSTIGYQYDAVNRVTTKTLPGNNNFTYTYDAKGRITTATNESAAIAWTYDAIDRPLSEALNGHSTTYAYNTAARTSNLIYPDGSNITWNFDTRNRLVSINKGLTAIVNYQYNNANQLQQLNYANGITTNFQYDQQNRLTNLTTQTNMLPSLVLTYDNESNKAGTARPNFPQASEQYGYDAGHRLTSFTQGTIQNNYNYDGLGNRTTAIIGGSTNTYTANNLNQYTSLNNGIKTTNFTYDGNGNLTYDGLFAKRYDVEGRLLVDSGNGKLVYKYDALGRRIQKTFNGKSINYYYSGISQLEQRDASNDTILNETVYSGSITPVMIGVNHNNYYYHQNDLNSVEAISNSSGNLVERYQYDAYGSPSFYDATGNALPASTIGNRFAFTGQEYDAETQNYHFHFRYYNPVTGSFNQRDPTGYADGMGIYQYVHDNPANGMDLLGLDDCVTSTTSWINTAETVESWVSTVNTPTSAYIDNVNKYHKHLTTKFDKYISSLSQEAKFKYFEDINKFGRQVQALEKESELAQIGSKGKFLSASSKFSTGLTWLDVGFKGYDLASTLLNSNSQSTDYAMAGGNLTQSILGFTPAGALYNGADMAQSLFTGKSMNQWSAEAGQVYGSNDVDQTQDEQEAEFHRQQGDFVKWNRIRKQQIRKQWLYTQSRVPNCPQNNNPNGNQNPTPPGPGHPGIPIKTTNTNSKDPNEIIGPAGVGTPQFVNAVNPMAYTINFENSVNASAPAKTVRINYPIDPKQDMKNISLGSFGFNSLTFNVPANTAAYYQRLDARDSLGLYVDITAGLDVNNHQIFWVFQSIDPVTLLTPSDPLKGFLLLTDTSNPASGHGFVNFFIKPLSGDVTGDTTHAIASIVFDGNDTIPTNVAKNTIDAVAPTSHVNALPANSASTVVPLSWAAADDANGSGVQSYSLYVAVNNGSFGLYATNIAAKDTTFTGAGGNSYSFFVLATDSVGNTETLKPGAEATTYINSVPLPVTWLYFNAVLQNKDGVLTWATATETNTKSFEVERSLDGRNFTAIGSVAAAGNSTLQSNYTYTDKNVTLLNIPVVYYRLKQIDKDGKSTYSNIVAVQLPMVNVGPIVQAYPNPFKQTLNVLIANMTALDLSDNIAIYTLEGKIVYEKPIGQRLLNTTITLTDLPQLTPGMYVLKLGLNKQTYSFKLMKQ